MKLTTIYNPRIGGSRAIIDFPEDSFIARAEFVYDAKTLTFTLFHHSGTTEIEEGVNSSFMEGLRSLLLQSSGSTNEKCPHFSFATPLPPGELLTSGHDSLFGLEDNIHAHDLRFRMNFYAHAMYPHYHIEYFNVEDPYPLMQTLLQVLANFDLSMKNNEQESTLFCRYGFYFLYEKIINPSYSPLDLNLSLQQCIENFTANTTNATPQTLEETRTQASAVFAKMMERRTHNLFDVTDVPTLVDTIQKQLTEQMNQSKIQQENERKRMLERQKRNWNCSLLFFGTAAIAATALTVKYLSSSEPPSNSPL